MGERRRGYPRTSDGSLARMMSDIPEEDLPPTYVPPEYVEQDYNNRLYRINNNQRGTFYHPWGHYRTGPPGPDTGGANTSILPDFSEVPLAFQQAAELTTRALSNPFWALRDDAYRYLDRTRELVGGRVSYSILPPVPFPSLFDRGGLYDASSYLGFLRSSVRQIQTALNASMDMDRSPNDVFFG